MLNKTRSSAISETWTFVPTYEPCLTCSPQSLCAHKSNPSFKALQMPFSLERTSSHLQPFIIFPLNLQNMTAGTCPETPPPVDPALWTFALFLFFSDLFHPSGPCSSSERCPLSTFPGWTEGRYPAGFPIVPCAGHVALKLIICLSPPLDCELVEGGAYISFPFVLPEPGTW